MIKVGIDSFHGISKEIVKYPPEGVKFIAINPEKNFLSSIIKPATSYKYYNPQEVDLIEAPIFPLYTNLPWVYTPGDSHTFMSFNIRGVPIPRIIRSIFVRKYFEKNNLLGLFFKSEAGKDSLKEYPFLLTDKILSKVRVVYPAIRKIPDELIKFKRDNITILFSGFFIRKGGIHVVEAFEMLQKEFKNIKLIICSKDNFMTDNKKLEREFKQRIKQNKDISFGWIDREELFSNILPFVDIFVCPTYKDTYGYAIVEAMAFGIPVIATDYFAIPEIVEHGKSGFLIKTKDHSFIKNLKGYIINDIPDDFHEYMTREVYNYLKILIKDFNLRKEIGMEALHRARTKFSFDKRNSIMLSIYKNALDLGTNRN